MMRGVALAGALLALAVFGWRAARRSPPAVLFSAQPSGKLRTLNEILGSRNDNDPRLDSDFNSLSPEDKRRFRQDYAMIPRESRNERGTIVYLLGKNMATAEDWTFLRDVAGEPPCLSLANCAKPPNGEGDPGDDVTLAYPSLVALKRAQKALEEGTATKEARAVVEAARGSKMPAVLRLAGRIEKKFPSSAK
ncbi:MAG: hypothetical protein KGL74_02765 [Elusimicrobia bacterium]|nr:hypothetical protein [Elusimicrobiota bacterium]MDE2510021.1 hypothetical protein [Elusimicrobiota bacterium]